MSLKKILLIAGFVLPAAIGYSLLTPFRALADPTILENFQGVTFSDTRGIPPDTMGAAGPSHFVEFVNGAFGVFNKNGTFAQPLITDVQFWKNAGINSPGGVFDPRIVFDPPSQRWFAVESNFDNNQVFVARSNTSDPSGGWKAVQFSGIGRPGSIQDFPTLGVDADGVLIGANPIRTGIALGTSLYSIPKSDMLATNPTVTNMTRFEGLTNVFLSPQAGLDFGPSKGHAAIIDALPHSIGEIDRYTVTGEGAAGALLSATTRINVLADYTNPINARQPDGTANLELAVVADRYGSSVFEVGSRLFLVHTVRLNSTGRDAIRWTILDERTNTVIQEGTIGDPNFDFFYPSVAANAKGDIVFGFNRSGLTSNVSSFAQVCSTSRDVVACGNPFLLAEGLVGNYHLVFGDGVNRWGDYSATTIDPNDPFAFWTIQEIPIASDSWATQITEILVPVPEPATFVLMGLGLLGLAARRRLSSSGRIGSTGVA